MIAVPSWVIDAQESTLSLQASSSLHPINGVADTLRGTVDVDESGAPTAMALELRVADIASGNAMYDRTLPRAVDARKFPSITATSTAVEPRGEDRFLVRGEVTFHGRTVAADGEVTVTRTDGGARLQGSHRFDVRDFGVTPPKLLGLKVHPDITVTIDLRAVADT